MEKQSLKILIYKWRAYNYKDIIANFQLLGYHVTIIEQELKSYDEDAKLEMRLTKMFSENKYDMVFTVNYYGCISDVCQKYGMKYVSWTCDSPLISMYHRSVYNECNYIFTFDKTNYLEFTGMGVKNIWYLPLAVDTKRLDNLLQTSEDLYLYQNEVAFVGSLYERNTYDKLQDVLPDYLKGYFEATMQAQMSIRGMNIIDEMLTADILEQLQKYFHLEKTKDSFSDIGLIFSTTVLGFKIAAIQRKRALVALSAKCPVAIYSNSNTRELIRAQYRGGVDYWGEMPKVFRSSKINLNFTIPNIKSGLPLRIWDVLGAGGFLMTDYQAEIPLYFEEGKDLVCFDDERDLVKKALYYLAHDQERQQIAENGYQKVRKLHSYGQRMREMLHLMGMEISGTKNKKEPSDE